VDTAKAVLDIEAFEEGEVAELLVDVGRPFRWERP
jgi:pyruvate/2-oxoglutarate dehydrogenase complex dihydrolipoamide acyltransferase (E2) component